MHLYSGSLTQYNRLPTREINIGGLLLGNFHPIRIQTMTTTDTMNTLATVEQSIRCIEAGAELIRITAPSKNEALNLQAIKDELRKRGFHTPLIADIHFTPNAAEIAARIVEKVRVNPGNYVDKKKFEQIEYTDAEYAEEIDRIRERFTPLIHICKEYGTAMRIGTNHGSLSDRIMSRYGDTPMGMVESAMEFLRIARAETYHNIVLSMKSSNPQVMVQAYRMLVKTMLDEFGEAYPLHLGVTEAGDGEDGRIKSAIGIGTLLEDGIGDTIRVSLTEDPEFEIPVCQDIVRRYTHAGARLHDGAVPEIEKLTYDPFNYKRRESFAVENAGGKQVPVVIADYSKAKKLEPSSLEPVGYFYDAATDKWTIKDGAPDFIFCNALPGFALPGTLKVVCNQQSWHAAADQSSLVPLFEPHEYLDAHLVKSKRMNVVMVDAYSKEYPQPPLEKILDAVKKDKTVVLAVSSLNSNAMQSVRRLFVELDEKEVHNPVVLITDSSHDGMDEALVHYAVETGALLLDGFGDGLCFGYHFGSPAIATEYGRMNTIAFGILQATRTRISKTEYISCPSCGRTLFDLQETTAKIRAVTNHLKGVKIAIMGCIVNGPGEMADADFGYVGSGPGKITLYKGKEIIRRNVNSDVAVEELVSLLKEYNAWVDQ